MLLRECSLQQRSTRESHQFQTYPLTPFRGKDTAAGFLLPRTFPLQDSRRSLKSQTKTPVRTALTGVFIAVFYLSTGTMGGVCVKDTAENPRTSPLFCQTLESIPQSIFAASIFTSAEIVFSLRSAPSCLASFSSV